MPLPSLALATGRREDRDEVYHRTRARIADGRELSLVIVNISPSGFMARCDLAMPEDSGLSLYLPRLGWTPATVRWALGGRIGGEFDAAMKPQMFNNLLATLRP